MLLRESSLNHNAADWYFMLWKRKKYGKNREDLEKEMICLKENEN